MVTQLNVNYVRSKWLRRPHELHKALIRHPSSRMPVTACMSFVDHLNRSPGLQWGPLSLMCCMPDPLHPRPTPVSMCRLFACIVCRWQCPCTPVCLPLAHMTIISAPSPSAIPRARTLVHPRALPFCRQRYFIFSFLFKFNKSFKSPYYTCNDSCEILI